MQVKNDGYINALTGVRAIAAYMVFLHHFNPFNRNSAAGNYFYGFTQEFHVGVTLFFVLSGFLIAYRYFDMKDFSFRQYMGNRIARIYPMYFLLTTATFMVNYFFRNQDSLHQLKVYLLNITFLRGFFEEFKFSGIAQGWSLTVEETFYLLAPAIFLLLRRNVLYFLVLPVLLIAFGVGLVTIFSRIYVHGFFSSYDLLFNYSFFGRPFEFFIGILLSVVYKKKLVRVRFRYFTYTGILGIILSICLLSFVKGDYDLGIRHPVGKLTNTFLLPLFGIAVFYYGLLTEKTLVSKILGSKPFVLLGKSSYIFYLIHMGIFSLALKELTNNALLIFLAINIISIGLFKYCEEPLNLYFRKKFAKKTPDRPRVLAVNDPV